MFQNALLLLRNKLKQCNFCALLTDRENKCIEEKNMRIVQIVLVCMTKHKHGVAMSTTIGYGCFQ